MEMIGPIKSLLLLLTISSSSPSATYQSRTSSPYFQQEVANPSSRNDIFEGSFTIGKHPVQISAGIRLKSPPFRLPHFLPPMPDLDFLPRPERSRVSSRIPFFFPLPLFTPNTEKRPAATRGQVDEYNKALEEEALEKEEEKKNSGKGSSGQYDKLEDFGVPTQHFVSVKSDQYNYKYTL